MKRITKAALPAILVGLLAVGSAHAETLNDSVELVYNVEAACVFNLSDAQLAGDATLSQDFGIIQRTAAAGSIDVQCNDGVAYTIETDAAAGGLVNLIGASTGGTVPAYLFQGEQGDDGEGGIAYGTPLSTDANGEAIVGVANGVQQSLSYQVAFNTTPDGRTMLPVPAADSYSAVVNFTLTY